MALQKEVTFVVERWIHNVDGHVLEGMPSTSAPRPQVPGSMPMDNVRQDRKWTVRERKAYEWPAS